MNKVHYLNIFENNSQITIDDKLNIKYKTFFKTTDMMYTDCPTLFLTYVPI